MRAEDLLNDAESDAARCGDQSEGGHQRVVALRDPRDPSGQSRMDGENGGGERGHQASQSHRSLPSGRPRRHPWPDDRVHLTDLAGICYQKRAKLQGAGEERRGQTSRRVHPEHPAWAAPGIGVGNLRPRRKEARERCWTVNVPAWGSGPGSHPRSSSLPSLARWPCRWPVEAFGFKMLSASARGFAPGWPGYPRAPRRREPT